MRRCPTCGTDATLVKGGTVFRRHVARNAPASAPRAARICEASGMRPDEAPLRVADHFARPKSTPVTPGDPCTGCAYPIGVNAVGACRHLYELEGAES